MEKRWIWPFELEEQIGSGAMGVVYRARYVKNDRRVALKLLPREVAANPALSARFAREMEILKNLKHPHIVHCFGGTTEGDHWFYAMELILGGSIQTLILKHGKIPWRQTVQYGIEICDALQHAHNHGVIHRDLKPANVLLSKTGKTKLSDFGLALVTAESRLTASGKTLGTMHYMAPEQIRGSKEQSNRTDLYALGCTFFEMLTGNPPFSGQSFAQILNKHLKEAPPRVCSQIDDCPPELDQLVADLLEKDPDRRPSDALAVTNRLQRMLMGAGPGAATEKLTMPVITEVGKRQSGPRPQIPTGIPLSEERLWGPSWLQSILACVITAVLVGGAGVWHAWSLQRELSGVLATQLEQPAPEVKLAALRTISRHPSLGGAHVAKIAALLSDRDLTLRSEAIQTLGKLGPSAAFAEGDLRKLAQQDAEPQIRAEALAASKQVLGTGVGARIARYAAWIIVAGAISAAVYWGRRLYQDFQQSQNQPQRSLFS